MSINTSHVTVTTTATLLASGPGAIYLASEGGSIYIGDSSVTTTTGLGLQGADNKQPFHLSGGDSLYGIIASGTAVIDVLKIS